LFWVQIKKKVTLGIFTYDDQPAVEFKGMNERVINIPFKALLGYTSRDEMKVDNPFIHILVGC